MEFATAATASSAAADERVCVVVCGDTPVDGRHHDGSEAKYRTVNGRRGCTSQGLNGTHLMISLAGGVRGTTVRALKQRISEELSHRCQFQDYGVEQQQLVWKGITLGYDKQAWRYDNDRTLGSYLPDAAAAASPIKIGVVFAKPRLNIIVVLAGKPKRLVVKPFDPRETPGELKAWYLSTYLPDVGEENAPSFKPMHFDGQELDDGVAIGEQAVTHGRMVMLEQVVES
jgi:hypothetical protein